MLKPPLGRVPRGDLPGRDLPAAPGHGYKSCLERGRICVCNNCGRRSVTTCVTCKYVVFRRFRRRRSLQVTYILILPTCRAERARSSQDQGKRRGFNFKRGPGPRAAPQRERFERRRGGSGPLGHRASPTGSADPAQRLGVENFVTTHPAAPAGPGSGRAPARARRK